MSSDILDSIRLCNGQVCRILTVSAENEAACLALLQSKLSTSLFLLDNLSRFGVRMSDHHHSGDWYCLIDELKIVRSILVVLRKGHVLYQADGEFDYSAEWTKFLRELRVCPTGLIGDWQVCKTLWDSFKRELGAKAEFESLEVLMDRDLRVSASGDDDVWECAENTACSMLREADFEAWQPLRIAYLKEAGMKIPTLSVLTENYSRECSLKFWWGGWLQGELISIAALKLTTHGMGQVAGVFTVPAYRQRGFGRAVMNALLRDSIRVHSLRKIVLFTGVNNIAAQRLYASLQFKQLNHFCLAF